MAHMKAVYLVRDNTPVRPVCSIEQTASGRITYSVKVSGRTIARCRELAQNEFSALRTFVAHLERKQKVEEKA